MTKINLTNQQMFDIAHAGIIEQGKPGTNAAGDCVYKGSDGSMCAVGLIFDNQDIHGLRDLDGDVLEAASALDIDLTGEQISFMESMQAAHDTAAQTGDNSGFLDRFRENMNLVAKNYSLKIPSVN